MAKNKEEKNTGDADVLLAAIRAEQTEQIAKANADLELAVKELESYCNGLRDKARKMVQTQPWNDARWRELATKVNRRRATLEILLQEKLPATFATEMKKPADEPG